MLDLQVRELVSHQGLFHTRRRKAGLFFDDSFPGCTFNQQQNTTREQPAWVGTTRPEYLGSTEMLHAKARRACDTLPVGQNSGLNWRKGLIVIQTQSMGSTITLFIYPEESTPKPCLHSAQGGGVQGSRAWCWFCNQQRQSFPKYRKRYLTRSF